MMSDDMVEIATYGSKLEAELAKQRLVAAGIAAFVGSDSAGGMIPSLGMAEGHRLLVSGEDADNAISVLEEETSSTASEPDESASGIE
jgi:hypothetical protein